MPKPKRKRWLLIRRHRQLSVCKGYTYQQERGFDVAQDAAKNEAAGQFSNMGIGLGMMAGVGGTVGGMVGGVVSDAFAGVEMHNHKP